MKPEDIQDKESLQAWLEARPEVTRHRDAVWIAFRAAARVYPLYASRTHPIFQRRDMSLNEGYPLSSLRCLLTCQAAAIKPTPELSEAANSAAVRDDGVAPYVFAVNASYYFPPFAAAVRAVQGAAFVADVDADAIWDAVRTDGLALTGGLDLQDMPLWGQPPEWFRDAKVAQALRAKDDQPDLWRFWQGWWNSLSLGRTLPWALLNAVALIPDAIWQKGAAAVAEEIRRIEQLMALAQEAATLQQAVKHSGLNWRR